LNNESATNASLKNAQRLITEVGEMGIPYANTDKSLPLTLSISTDAWIGKKKIFERKNVSSTTRLRKNWMKWLKQNSKEKQIKVDKTGSAK